MKKIITAIIIILSTLNIILTQEIPDRHLDAKLEAQYKSERLARIIQMESQMTTNQDFYNVKHYDLNLNIDVSAKQITGSVKILSKVVKQAINQLDVNLLNNMTVDSIYNNNKKLTRSLYDRGFSRQQILELFRFIGWIMELPQDLDDNFGKEGMRELPNIKKIKSLERLRLIFNAIKTVQSLDELRQIYNNQPDKM